MPRLGKLYLIERTRSRQTSRVACLQRFGHDVTTADSLACALKGANGHDLIILDAASMRTAGTRMASRLCQRFESTPLILISPEGTDPSRTGAADAMLIEPFTARKLGNRIQELLPLSETKASTWGPLDYNLDRRLIRRGNNQVQLTPMLAALLKYMLNKKGCVVTRKELMREVWQTNYTKDTRTIDTHIRWLRQAIERDPARPRLLRTLRGVGYRLDLPDSQHPQKDAAT